MAEKLMTQADAIALGCLFVAVVLVGGGWLTGRILDRLFPQEPQE